jgi:hypothetical protein
MNIFMNVIFMVVGFLGLVFCAWVLWMDYSSRSMSVREQIKRDNEKKLRERMRRAG